MNPKESVIIYKQLAKVAGNLKQDVPASHKYLFNTGDSYYSDYLKFYLIQKERIFVELNPVPPPMDDRCVYCKKFHVQNLKNINKNLDIQFGIDLEDTFLTFINNKLLLEGSDLRLEYAARQKEDFHMPDIKVINPNGESVFFIEFKCIFRPFIKIKEKVNSSFECYSNSMTLDISNGKKLENQKGLVEKVGIDKVAYVYWYDLPCVKGIFWMPARMVYEIWSNQDNYSRKIVDGDYGQNGELRGSINKIYLPLHQMNDFSSLFYVIKSLGK